MFTRFIIVWRVASGDCRPVSRKDSELHIFPLHQHSHFAAFRAVKLVDLFIYIYVCINITYLKAYRNQFLYEFLFARISVIWSSFGRVLGCTSDTRTNGWGGTQWRDSVKWFRLFSVAKTQTTSDRKPLVGNNMIVIHRTVARFINQDVKTYLVFRHRIIPSRTLTLILSHSLVLRRGKCVHLLYSFFAP